MPEAKRDTRTVMFENLLEKHQDALGVFQEIVKPLMSVLEGDGIYEISTDNSILTRFESGMVFHAPVPLGDKIAKKDLETRTHPVSVLANTVPLLDSVSKKELEPGSYVVRLRPLPERGFALDFVDENHRVALSTRATPTDPGAFEALPEEPQALAIRLGLIDASIGPKDCVDAISGGHIPGPVCYQEICLSFWKWKKCFIVTLPEVVAQP